MRRIDFHNSDAPTDLHLQTSLDLHRWKLSYAEADFIPVLTIPNELLAKNKPTKVPLKLAEVQKRVTLAEKIIPQDLLDKSYANAKKVSLVRQVHRIESTTAKKREQFGTMRINDKGKIEDEERIAEKRKQAEKSRELKKRRVRAAKSKDGDTK